MDILFVRVSNEVWTQEKGALSIEFLVEEIEILERKIKKSVNLTTDRGRLFRCYVALEKLVLDLVQTVGIPIYSMGDFPREANAVPKLNLKAFYKPNLIEENILLMLDDLESLIIEGDDFPKPLEISSQLQIDSKEKEVAGFLLFIKGN